MTRPSYHSYPQPPSATTCSLWQAVSVAILFLCFVLRFMDSADAAAFCGSVALRRHSHKKATTATPAAPSILWTASTDSGNILDDSHNNYGGAAVAPISMSKATRKRRLLHFNPKEAIDKIKKSGHSVDTTKNIGRTLVMGTIGDADAVATPPGTVRSKIEEAKEGAGAKCGDEATATDEEKESHIPTFNIGCDSVEQDEASTSASPEATAATGNDSDNHRARARTSTALFASSSGSHDKTAQRVAKSKSTASTRKPQKARSVLKKIHGRLRPTSSFVPVHFAKHEKKTPAENRNVILEGGTPAAIKENPNLASDKNPRIRSTARRNKSDESDSNYREAASDMSNTTTKSNGKGRFPKFSSESNDILSLDNNRVDGKKDEKKASGFSFFAKTQEEKIAVSKYPVQMSSELKIVGKSTPKAKKAAVSTPLLETKEDSMTIMMPLNATNSSTNPCDKKNIKSGTTTAKNAEESPAATLKANARTDSIVKNAKVKTRAQRKERIKKTSTVTNIENPKAKSSRELGPPDSPGKPNSDIMTPSYSKAFSIEAEDKVIMESEQVVADGLSSEILQNTESVTTPKATPTSESVASENINSSMHNIQNKDTDDGTEIVSVFDSDVSTSTSSHETNREASRIGENRVRSESKGGEAKIGGGMERLKESVDAVTVDASNDEAKSVDFAKKGISPLLSLADSLASIDIVRAEKEKIRTKPPPRISPSPRSRAGTRSMPRPKSVPQSQVYRGARPGVDEPIAIPNADERGKQTPRRSRPESPNISTERSSRGRPKPTRSPPPAPVVTTDRSTRRKGAQTKSRVSHDTSSTPRTRTAASNSAEEAKFTAMRNQFMSTGINSENPGSSGRQVSAKRISVEPYATTEAPSNSSTESCEPSIGKPGFGSEISSPATTTFSSEPYQPAFDVGTDGPQVVSFRTVNTKPYGLSNAQESVEYTRLAHPEEHAAGQVEPESSDHPSFDTSKDADQQASHPYGDTAGPPPQDREPPRPKSPAEEARAALMRKLVGDPEVEASEGYKPAFDMGSSGSQKVSTRQVSSAPYSPSGNTDPVVVFDKTRKKKKYRPADPSSQPSISLISSGGDTQTVQSTQQVLSAAHQRSESSISQQISISQVSAPPREPLEGGGTIMISGDKAPPVRKSKKKIPASFASGAASGQDSAESYQRSFDIDSSGPQQVSTRTVSTTPFEGTETIVDYKAPPDPETLAYEASQAAQEPYRPSFDIGASSGPQMVSERRVNPQPYGMPSFPNTANEIPQSSVSPRASNISPAPGSTAGSYLPKDAQDGVKFDYSSPQQAASDTSSMPYEPTFYDVAPCAAQAATGLTSSDIFQSQTLEQEPFVGLDDMVDFSESQPYQTMDEYGSHTTSSSSIGQYEAKEYGDAQQLHQLHDEMPQDSENVAQKLFDTRDAYFANKTPGRSRAFVDGEERHSSHIYEDSTQQLRHISSCSSTVPNTGSSSFSQDQVVSQQGLHYGVEGGNSQENLQSHDAAVTPEPVEFLAQQVDTESNQMFTVGDNTPMVFCQFSPPEPSIRMGNKSTEEIEAELSNSKTSSQPPTQPDASSAGIGILSEEDTASIANVFTPAIVSSKAPAAPVSKGPFECQPAIKSDQDVASFTSTVPPTQFDKQGTPISPASLSGFTESNYPGFTPNSLSRNHGRPFASTLSPPLPGPAQFGTDPGFVPQTSGISTIAASPVVQGAMPGAVVANGAVGGEEMHFSAAVPPEQVNSVLPSNEHTESQESCFPQEGTPAGTPAASAPASAQKVAPGLGVAFVANIKNRWMGGVDSPATTTLASSPERSAMEVSSKPEETTSQPFSTKEKSAQSSRQQSPPQPMDFPLNSFSSKASPFSQTTISATEGKNTFASPTSSVSETSSDVVAAPAADRGLSADASLHPAYLAAIAASLQVTAVDDTAELLLENATLPSAPLEPTFGMRKVSATKAYLDNLGTSTSLFALSGSVLEKSKTSGSLQDEPSYLSPDAQNEYSSADQSGNQAMQISLNTPRDRGHDVYSSFSGAQASDWSEHRSDHAGKRDSSLDSTNFSLSEAVNGMPWDHGPAFKEK